MYQISTSVLENKLYSRANDFKYFKQISLERSEKIKTDVKIFRERIKDDINASMIGNPIYRKALLYLTNPRIALEYPTFDERILFLIYSIDENLEIFSTFLNSDIPRRTTPPTSSKQDETEEAKRSQAITQLKENIYEKTGIGNLKLITYESALFRRFNKEFKTKIKADYLKTIIEYARLTPDFNTIDEQTYSRIMTMVSYYYLKTNNETSPNTVAFNIISHKNLLLLKNSIEQLIFFIAASDPELTLLKIFEEESNYQEIKKRAIEELGYYSEDILRLEKSYHKCFCPDKKISAWSL